MTRWRSGATRSIVCLRSWLFVPYGGLRVVALWFDSSRSVSVVPCAAFAVGSATVGCAPPASEKGWLIRAPDVLMGEKLFGAATRALRCMLLSVTPVQRPKCTFLMTFLDCFSLVHFRSSLMSQPGFEGGRFVVVVWGWQCRCT